MADSSRKTTGQDSGIESGRHGGTAFQIQHCSRRSTHVHPHSCQAHKRGWDESTQVQCHRIAHVEIWKRFPGPTNSTRYAKAVYEAKIHAITQSSLIPSSISWFSLLFFLRYCFRSAVRIFELIAMEMLRFWLSCSSLLFDSSWITLDSTFLW